LAEFDSFCPNCGQKKTDGKTDMHELMHEFVHMWLHFDGKFISTLKHLFIPAKLTIEFFRGHHKRYAHPVQLYFLLSAFYIFANAVVNSSQKTNLEALTDNFRVRAMRHVFLADLDTVLRQNTEGGILAKPLKDSVLAQTEKRWRAWEEARIENRTVRDTNQLAFSIGQGIEIKRDTTEGRGKKKSDNSQITQFVKWVGFDSIDPVDLTLMTEEELFEKYQPKNRLQTYFLRQSQHFFQRGENIMDKLQKYIFWTSFAVLPISGGILFLLYRRRPQNFYVEHLVFLLHYSASSYFFYGLVFFASTLAGGQTAKASAQFIGILLAYPFLLFAMKYYYKQGWGKTLLKFLIYAILSFIVGLLAAVIAFALTILLF
jgi:hypothetical protein